MRSLNLPPPVRAFIAPSAYLPSAAPCQQLVDQVTARQPRNSSIPRAPIGILSEAEGAALAWHLRYWLGEARWKPGYSMRDEIMRSTTCDGGPSASLSTRLDSRGSTARGRAPRT